MKETIKCKEKLILEVMEEMNSVLDLNDKQKIIIENILGSKFSNYEIKEDTESDLKYSNLSFEEIFKIYRSEMVVRGRSESTLKQYKRENQKLVEYAGTDFRHISKENVIDYLSYKSENGASFTYLDNIRRYCSSFYDWAVEAEIISNNPFRKIRKVNRDPIKKVILTDEEIAELRDNCITLRERAMIDFLLSTGVRVSELVGAKLDDVNFNDGSVNIFSTKTKQYRKVYLDAQSLKHLKEYRNTINEEYLFSKRGGGKISKESAEHIVRNLCERCHISKHITVHTFRKTLASKLLRKGMKTTSIAKILGHASFTTTEKFYTYINGEDVRREFLLYI